MGSSIKFVTTQLFSSKKIPNKSKLNFTSTNTMIPKSYQTWFMNANKYENIIHGLLCLDLEFTQKFVQETRKAMEKVIYINIYISLHKFIIQTKFSQTYLIIRNRKGYLKLMLYSRRNISIFIHEQDCNNKRESDKSCVQS